MKVALFIGDHSKDGFTARLGYKVIRFGQTQQKFGEVTHCEAILAGPWDAATIASASLRDGGVRVKTTDLDPTHWLIWDVPLWDAEWAAAWFRDHEGTQYSLIGAASSASLFVNLVLNTLGKDPKGLGQWCSRSLGDSQSMVGAEDMSVSELCVHMWNLPGTRDITTEYFGKGVQ